MKEKNHIKEIPLSTRSIKGTELSTFSYNEKIITAITIVVLFRFFGHLFNVVYCTRANFFFFEYRPKEGLYV